MTRYEFTGSAFGTVGAEALRRVILAASADTHPKDGDVKQAPLVSGAVPKADAQTLPGSTSNNGEDR